MMRMVRVHVEDHAAWSEDHAGWGMDGESENHIGLVVRWDFRWDRGLDRADGGRTNGPINSGFDRQEQSEDVKLPGEFTFQDVVSQQHRHLLAVLLHGVKN